jgi:hypothetical protein
MIDFWRESDGRTRKRGRGDHRRDKGLLMVAMASLACEVQMHLLRETDGEPR